MHLFLLWQLEYNSWHPAPHFLFWGWRNGTVRELNMNRQVRQNLPDMREITRWRW
jgi:hypothetical protein